MGPRAAQKSGKHPDRNRDCSAPTGRTPPCTELLKNELYKVRMEAWRDDSSFGTVLPPTQFSLDASHPSTLTVRKQTLAGHGRQLDIPWPSNGREEARAAGAERCPSDEAGGRGPLAEPTGGGRSRGARAARSDVGVD